MSSNKLSIRSCLMVLLFHAALIQAACRDSITPLLAPGNNICWAACADMILQYYGNPPNMHGIWVRGTDGVDIVNSLCDVPPPGAIWNVHDILDSGNPEQNIPSECQGGVVLWNELQTYICDAKPFFAGLSGDHGHVVLVIGWKNNGTVEFNDPENGQKLEFSYDYFCENDYCYWIQSMIPEEGSPVGLVPVAEPSISITSGPAEFVYPGSNTTYTSTFYCPSGQICIPPYQWNWSLEFFHKNGNYTVASIQNLQGYGASTWNIPAFTLPSGYEWQYNADGKIMGFVTVSTTGYFDWKDVTYAPQTLIPGYVHFKNQTVSGPHADVAAHYCIYIENVAINSTAEIEFKAGSCVTIEDLTVQNGSDVTIKVDPALQ